MTTSRYRLRPFHTGIPLATNIPENTKELGLCVCVCTGLPYVAVHNYLLSNKALQLHELSVQAAGRCYEFRRTKFELAASQARFFCFFFLFCLFASTNFPLLSTFFLRCACIAAIRTRSVRAPHHVDCGLCKLFNYVSCKQQCLSECALSQCPKHPSAFTL